MTAAEHEAAIDAAERNMLQADNRTDRAMFAQQFLEAINARNAARTPEELAEMERQRGLR